MLGKLRGHFAPAYLGESIKLRAYLFFIYVWGSFVDEQAIYEKKIISQVF